MPKIGNENPKTIQPYIFHGVRLEIGQDQAIGDCPFCQREDKFSVAVETGLWRCYVCGEGSVKGGGNLITFLRLLWNRSAETTNGESNQLTTERGFLCPETLSYWGVVQSYIDKTWLIPGYDAGGKLGQLYRYSKDFKTGRMKLYPTPTLHHQLHGPAGLKFFDPKKPDVYICEGPWDGMAFWETMRVAKEDGDHLTFTGSVEASLLHSANILAVPGCNSFNEKWLPLFAGKRVHLLYDSDHPRASSGKVFTAGYDGMKRASQLLAKHEEPPAEIHYLEWGPEGYDPALASGYDLRDWLNDQQAEVRVEQLQKLRDTLIHPIPEGWLVGRSKLTSRKGGVEIDCEPCDSWDALVQVWRRAMKWTEGLDRALSVMLAAVTSTKAVGDQLWCKIIGPAACGKSTLCEALSVNRRHIVAKSTIRGFHSGYRESKAETEDNSLVSLLYDKTLVTKDGDTLLSSPNLEQILSEARDLYDSTSRTHYRNKASKDYHGVRMTWLLCGTSSLRKLDSSELGERFLDCVIMEEINEELEDEILWRKANQADSAMSFEADGKLDTQHAPEMLACMKLTGGYINHLRENAQSLLDQATVSDEAKRECISLAKFVAYMRARPSTRQDETAERELATRLTSQIIRLAKCLTVVLNRKEVDEEVLRRVRRVALDTARGKTLEIIKCLAAAPWHEGVPLSSASIQLTMGELKLQDLLQFLRKIGAVEFFRKPAIHGIRPHPRWRLTKRMLALFNRVNPLDD